jgi:hypothetical protein
LEHTHKLPDLKNSKIKAIKELFISQLEKAGNIIENFTTENLILTSIHGTEMLDKYKLSKYDDSEEHQKVTLEIHVNFRNVIALRICN